MQTAFTALRNFQRENQANGAKIVPENDLNKARFSLRFDETSGFQIKDCELKSKCGRSTLPRSLPHNADEAFFRKVFRGISAFQYYLHHSEGTLDSTNLSISMYKVVQNTPGDDNLNINGSIVLQDLGSDVCYFVLYIENRTTYDLYPALFYFDECDLSISTCV